MRDPLRRCARALVRESLHSAGARSSRSLARIHRSRCGASKHGYTVAQLDPTTMEFRILAYGAPDSTFNGVSAAAFVGSDLWLASYQSDRIAVRALSYGISATREPIHGATITVGRGYK